MICQDGGSNGLQAEKIMTVKPHDNHLYISGLIYKLTIQKYHKVSNIRRTKSQNLNDSRLILHLSLPNLLKPGVK